MTRWWTRTLAEFTQTPNPDRVLDLLTGNEPNVFARHETRLWSWAHLSELLSNTRATSRVRMAKGGQLVPKHSYCFEIGSRTQGDTLFIDTHRLHAELDRGATLIVDSVDESEPRVREICVAFERLTDATMEANAYAARNPGSGFGWHRDDHATVIAQLEGRKRWHFSAATDDRAPSAETVTSVLLEPGDLMYVPANHWHDVEALGDPTLHLTFGLPDLREGRLRQPDDPDVIKERENLLPMPGPVYVFPETITIRPGDLVRAVPPRKPVVERLDTTSVEVRTMGKSYVLDNEGFDLLTTFLGFDTDVRVTNETHFPDMKRLIEAGLLQVTAR